MRDPECLIPTSHNFCFYLIEFELAISKEEYIFVVSIS
jgi:hypothetical protein